MVISTTLDEGLEPGLAIVATEEKPMMPAMDFDENRYVYHIGYSESGNSGPVIIVKRQVGGAWVLLWPDRKSSDFNENRYRY